MGNSDSGVKAGLAVFALAGLAMVAGGVAAAVDSVRFTSRAVAVEGTVTGTESRRSGKSSITWARTRVVLPGGAELETFFQEADLPGPAVEGLRVPVLYDPEITTDMRVDSFGALWFVPLLLGLLGLLITGGCAAGYRVFFPSARAPARSMPGGPWKQQVAEALRRGDKIDAIRRVREATGRSLAESKEIVEQLEKVRD